MVTIRSFFTFSWEVRFSLNYHNWAPRTQGMDREARARVPRPHLGTVYADRRAQFREITSCAASCAVASGAAREMAGTTATSVVSEMLSLACEFQLAECSKNWDAGHFGSLFANSKLSRNRQNGKNTRSVISKRCQKQDSHFALTRNHDWAYGSKIAYIIERRLHEFPTEPRKCGLTLIYFSTSFRK